MKVLKRPAYQAGSKKSKTHHEKLPKNLVISTHSITLYMRGISSSVDVVVKQHGWSMDELYGPYAHHHHF